MTKATWPEIAMAGTLFAILTDLVAVSQTGRTESEFESITIDHGVLRIEMRDGQEFELTVRQLK